MQDLTLQRVFVRVLTYLTESGVEMNRTQCRTLLELIDQALVDEGQESRAHAPDEARLLSCAMDRLPTFFPIPEEVLPAPNPPLWRRSIGYPANG